ncbi:MAG: hypothetical protein AABY53_07775 [Bdellovibrionota bacterium]
MTYEQSLKNIEVIKNLISPWSIDYIFFDFKTETEFEVVFFDKENSDKIEELIPVKLRAKLPIAHLHENKLGQVILHYIAKPLIYEYNLTTNSVVMNYISGQSRSCPAQMKLDMALLFHKLKNM